MKPLIFDVNRRPSPRRSTQTAPDTASPVDKMRWLEQHDPDAAEAVGRVLDELIRDVRGDGA